MINLTHKQLEDARSNSAFEDITLWDFENVAEGYLINYAQECFNNLDKEVQIDSFSEFCSNCKEFTHLFGDAEWHEKLERYLLDVFESQIIEHLNSEFDKFAQNYAEEQNNTHHSGE